MGAPAQPGLTLIPGGPLQVNLTTRPYSCIAPTYLPETKLVMPPWDPMNDTVALTGPLYTGDKPSVADMEMVGIHTINSARWAAGLREYENTLETEAIWPLMLSLAARHPDFIAANIRAVAGATQTPTYQVRTFNRPDPLSPPTELWQTVSPAVLNDASVVNNDRQPTWPVVLAVAALKTAIASDFEQWNGNFRAPGDSFDYYGAQRAVAAALTGANAEALSFNSLDLLWNAEGIGSLPYGSNNETLGEALIGDKSLWAEKNDNIGAWRVSLMTDPLAYGSVSLSYAAYPLALYGPSIQFKSGGALIVHSGDLGNSYEFQPKDRPSWRYPVPGGSSFGVPIVDVGPEGIMLRVGSADCLLEWEAVQRVVDNIFRTRLNCGEHKLTVSTT